MRFACMLVVVVGLCCPTVGVAADEYAEALKGAVTKHDIVDMVPYGTLKKLSEQYGKSLDQLAVDLEALRPERMKEQADTKRDVITVEGTAAGPARYGGGRRKLMARRGALMDGYRKLSEKLMELKTDDDQSLKNIVEGDPVLGSKVVALVRGATCTGTKYSAEDTATVTLELSLAKLKELLASKKLKLKAFP